MRHPPPATVPTSLAGRLRASLLDSWHRAWPTQRFGYLIGTASPTRLGWSGRAGRAPEPPGSTTRVPPAPQVSR
jgi:hypothetical protein